MRHKTNRLFSRAAMMLLTVLMAFAGAQRAQAAASLTTHITYNGVAASDVTVTVTYEMMLGINTYLDNTTVTDGDNISLAYANKDISVTVTSSKDISTTFSAFYAFEYVGGESTFPISVTTNGNSCTFTANDTYETTLNITVNFAPKYTVHFDKNSPDAEGTMDNQTFTVGETQSLTGNGFTRDDYFFTGWNTDAGGNGTAYSDGQSVTDLAEAGETVTLYAQWKALVTVNEDGTQTSGVKAIPLDGTETTLGGGTYYVGSNLYYDHPLRFTGNTVLILGNGCTMSVGREDARITTGDAAIYFTSSNYLNIYAQSTDLAVAGTLCVYAGNNTGICLYNGSYTQHSGNVVVDVTGSNQPGISTGGNITLGSGTLSVTSDNGDALQASGNVNINGGQLEAISRSTHTFYLGIKAINGICLGWRNATDYIMVNRFSGTIATATGQRFVAYDETTPTAIVGTGTVDKSTIDGKKLCPLDSYLVTSDDANVIIGSGTPTFTIDGTDYYAYDSGATVTLGSNREGYIADYTASPAQSISDGTFTMPAEDVTVSATWTPDPDDFAVSSDGKTYTIKTATGWNVFCDALLDLDTYNRFSGKTVKLGADIGTVENPITRMAGSSQHDFCGIFDGQGYTLTVDISSDDSRDYTAPFSYVSNVNSIHAAICNLNVAGTVSATKDYAGGIVGAFWGTLTMENCTSSVAINTNNKHAAGFISNARGDVTITNCLSSVTINSSKEGDGTHAGFIGASASGIKTTIQGSAFTGSLLTTNSTTHCAGFMGYNSGTLTITNSLYAPQADNNAVTDGATFSREHDDYAATITNSYYTQALGTAQGKAICTAPAAPVGDATHAKYTVSGITPYANGITRTVGDATAFYYGGGDNVSVSYVDENGSNASHDATALDETMTTLAAGWYYLGKVINYTQGVSLTSDATIILADGKTMTASGNSYGIDGSSDGSLTIYGQVLGTGTLNATGTTFGIYTEGTVNINGGKVNANGTDDVGIRSIDGVTINRGTVTTTGIMADNDVTINGGKFTATDDPGICSNDGTVTLGWTSTDDRIRADSYQGTVKIASGKGLYNGSEVLSGIITDMNKLEEETLTPAVFLVDNDDNSTAIATAATVCTGDKTLAVQLAGRTLYKDGAWNTLCLPFNVTIADSPLAGATVKELLTTSNLDNGTLTLNFSDNLTAIEAGKPYIVKWAKADGYDEADPETRDVKNPVFTGVTISNTTPTAVEFSIANSSDKCQFVGQYSLFDITAGNINSIIMLGANNTLGYSKNPRTLRSFRAHFEVPTHTGAPAMNSFVIDFGDESTGISLTPDPSPRGEGSEYYTLDGRKLDGKPTKKGMYIVNGQKVVIK